MTGMREELALLRGQVDYLLERIGALDGLDARPVAWDTLDADAAAQQWAALAGWTDWLIARYQLSEVVPACWYAHPAILEELSALHVAWVGAYCDPAARASDGVAWHDMLERVVFRIRERDVAGCATAVAHRADAAPAPSPESLTARADAIRADLASRRAPSAAPPAPSGPDLPLL